MKTKHVIIPTQSARHLIAGKVSANATLSGLQILNPIGNKEGAFRFPDGEVYLRVPQLKKTTKAVVVHSG